MLFQVWPSNKPPEMWDFSSETDGGLAIRATLEGRKAEVSMRRGSAIALARQIIDGAGLTWRDLYDRFRI